VRRRREVWPVTTPDVARPAQDEGPSRTFAFSIEGAVIGDRVYRSAITVFAVCVPLLLGLIALEVGRAAWPAVRRFGPAFLTSDTWDPVAGVFGAGPAIFGTILTSIIALVIATPLALGAAIFLA